MSFYVNSNPGPSKARAVICVLGQSNSNQKGLVSDLSGGDLVYGISNAAVWYSQLGYESGGVLSYDLPWGALSPTDSLTRMGYEMALGDNLSAPNGKYAIVKYWRGSTTAQNWCDNSWGTIGANYCKNQIKSLQNMLGEVCYPAAFIWCLGEDEVAGSVAAYPKRVESVWTEFRLVIGCPQLPAFLIETQMDTGIKAAEMALVAMDAHATFINTDAYPYAEPPHWDATQLCRIGELVASSVNSTI